MAGMYGLSFDFPNTKFVRTNMNYIYEFIQKVLLELNPGNLSNKVQGFQSMGYQ